MFAVLLIVLPLGRVTGLRNSLALLISVWALTHVVKEGLRLPIMAPIAAWLLVALASALWAPGAQEALKATVYDVALPGGVFYGAYVLCRQASPYRMAVFVITGGTILLAGLLMLTRALHPEVEDVGPAGFYTGVGVTSTLAVFALPIALLLINSSSRGFAGLGYTGLVSILVAGTASHNRMFWLSAVAVVLVFYAWQWSFLTRLQRAVPVLLIAVIASAIASYVNVREGRGPLDVVVRDNRPDA